jgi:hypothetical protein
LEVYLGGNWFWFKEKYDERKMEIDFDFDLTSYIFVEFFLISIKKYFRKWLSMWNAISVFFLIKYEKKKMHLCVVQKIKDWSIMKIIKH